MKIRETSPDMFSERDSEQVIPGSGKVILRRRPRNAQRKRKSMDLELKVATKRKSLVEMDIAIDSESMAVEHLLSNTHF